MSEPLRSGDVGARRRVLQRRVLLGTVTLIVFMWALWDVWGVPMSIFLEALLAIGLMIGAAMVGGALLGALLAWLRRRRD